MACLFFVLFGLWLANDFVTTSPLHSGSNLAEIKYLIPQRVKRQFGNRDSTLAQSLQNLQNTQQQLNNQPNQTGGFQTQNQGFGNSGIGPGGFLNINNSGFMNANGRPTNNNPGFISGQPTSQQTSTNNGQFQSQTSQSNSDTGPGGFHLAPGIVNFNQNQGESGFVNSNSNQGVIGSSQNNPGIESGFASSSTNFISPNNQSNFNQGTSGSQSSTVRNPFLVVTNENSLPTNIRNCVIRCPATNQYNPVCGNDGISYTNRYKLACANNCNYRVTQAYTGNCVAS